MALIYSPSLSSLFLSAMILPGGSGSYTTVFMAGPQPTPAAFIADWATTYKYPINCLGVADLAIGFTQQDILIGVTNPQTIVAFGTGTAAWAVMFDNNNWASASALSGGLPSNRFMLFSVSDTIGDGIIRLSSTSFVSGQSVTITDGGFTARMV